MSLTLTLERGGGEVSGSGTQIELEGTGEGYSLESVTMNGDTQQQTYSGKNLLFCRDTYNANGVDTVLQSDGSIVCTGRTTASWGYNWRPYQAALPKTIPAGTYTFSRSGTTTGSIAYVLYDSAKNQIASFNITSGNTSVTVTTTVDAYYDSGSVGQIGGTGAAVDRHYYLQFEASSTPTTFEKYVGGTASPNPDYPQEVQTVTGEQTITITDGESNSQSYTVNLGSIELCKIGTYQDYIYKSGDDWYVHKAIATQKYTGASAESWQKFEYSGVSMWRSTVIPSGMDTTAITTDSFRANNATYWVNDGTSVSSALSEGEFGFNAAASNFNIKWNVITTLSNWESWLTSNPMIVYYPLATPTDTQITNSALITQLDTLISAQTYDGTTYITVSSENLKGSLDVTSEAPIRKTYTEVEIGSPFTIADVEGKSSNTTLDGNVYVDWAYNKKQYSFNLFNLTPQDYADIRAYYDYQFSSGEFPTITVPELDIDKLPVYMEISSRNIINQCLLTDKLTIKFRETVQP